jgi:hypothetical protein
MVGLGEPHQLPSPTFGTKERFIPNLTPLWWWRIIQGLGGPGGEGSDLQVVVAERMETAGIPGFDQTPTTGKVDNCWILYGFLFKSG